MGTLEDDNKAVCHRLIAAFNEHDRAAFDACYAEEITIHRPDGAQQRMDHDQHWESCETTWRVFPDLQAELLGMIAEEDRVFDYWAYSGTHLGRGSRGTEPTGIHATWHAFADYRLADGRIIESWQLHDELSLLTQLGLVALPGS